MYLGLLSCCVLHPRRSADRGCKCERLYLCSCQWRQSASHSRHYLQQRQRHINGKGCVHIAASGYSQTVAVVERVHVEGFNDGVFFDNHVSGTASDIDCTNGCGNGVHIASCSDIVLSAITVTSATNIIRNDCSGKNIPRVAGDNFRTLSLYVQSNYGGNPAHASYWNGGQWVTE